MAEDTFDLVYDGPALTEGRMAVRDLAPALLSLGELFAEASVTLHPDRPAAALNIKATNNGSFLIDLILEGPGLAWDRAIDLFGSDPVEALANLKELVIAPGAGLFWYIARKRGRSVARQEDAIEPGKVRLTLDDDTVLEVPTDVLALHGSVEVRRKARRVIEPLNRMGVDRLEFRAEDDVVLTLTGDDVPAFEAEGSEEVSLLEREIEMLVSITAPAFVPGNKWRLTDGDRSFFAAIDDDAFQERVQHGIEFFRAGDMLRCRMRLVQTQQDGALHTEYHVAEVFEHVPRGTQLLLGEG